MRASVIILLALIPMQVLAVDPPFKAGYRQMVLSFDNDTQLILSVWYPSKGSADPVPILDFAFLHLRDAGDSVRAARIAGVRSNITSWFGNVEEKRWKELLERTGNSFRDAPMPDREFPLVIGRLRAFSTTLTCEHLAMNGFVVVMLAAVEDHPPDRGEPYLRQVSDEITYFRFIKDYFHEIMGIATENAGLLGFSGNGVSPFIAAMRTSEFKSIALIESAILTGPMSPIIARHPYFSRTIQSKLLFIYNKQKFEAEKMREALNKFQPAALTLHLIDNPDQHHWDLATEGTISSMLLENRTISVRERQLAEFQEMNDVIVNFFRDTIGP